jgi:hypothetical protein
MMSERRIVAIMIGLAMLATSCSKDDAIVKDYKLYDLDGSNQTIIGGSGMVKVSDVTAYNLEGDRIYFETGILDAPVAAGGQSDRCKYGFIDTAKNVVVAASLGSALQRAVVSKLTAATKGGVSRSCVSKS